MLRQLVVVALAIVSVALPAAGAAGKGAAAPTVSVLEVFATGGGPPAAARVGERSTITGNLEDAGGKTIGTWLWRCTYLGGRGLGTSTSHFCTFAAKLDGKGTIFSEGGIGYNSTSVRWNAVTGGTGEYRGVFGVVHIVDLATPRTPHTYYLMKR